jgi:hypothetical protein
MSIEFKIKGVEYTVKEPTIKDYYNLQNELVAEGLVAKMNIVSHLSGCEIENLKLLDKHQFTILWDHITTTYFDISETSAYHKNFLFNGKLYGFLDMANVTLGEFADMDVLKADPQSQKKLHNMMAILYRPAIQITDNWMEVEVYNSDEANKRAEEFLDLPLKYVYGALNFFLQVSKYLYENIVDSLIKTEELTTAQKQLLETASQLILELLETGITSSSIAQMKTSPKLKRLSELVLLESSTSLHTKQINEKKKRSFVKRWSSKIKDKLTWR